MTKRPIRIDLIHPRRGAQSSLLEGWALPVKLERGGVGERLKPAVLKTVGPERVPGVRIPPPPPDLS